MPPSDDLHVVVFDLETRKSAESVGGWHNLRAGKGGISVLIVHDSEFDTYLFYDEHTIHDFARLVEQPGIIAVGYNSKEFDVPCIQGVLQRRLNLLHHIDLFYFIADALDREGRHHERGWKLGDAALRAMGIEKYESGAIAPELCAQERYAELFTYCRHDVDMTRQLLDFIRRHGGVLDNSGNLLELDIPDWLRFPVYQER